VKKIRWGEIELSGNFLGQQINGKGYKKWRNFVTKTIKGVKPRETKVAEWYIYRGDLEHS
jgi:hypothetical protein